MTACSGVKNQGTNIQNDGSQKPLDKPEITSYSILGESKNLTKKQKEDMDKWRSEIVGLSKNNKDYIYINGGEGKKEVALTFDDGPDGKITPEILDILKKNNIHASFFFIGKYVDLYPDTVKRAYSEGNLVLNHSMSHIDLSNKSSEIIDKELLGNEDKIFNLINKRPAIMRPPYGAVTQLSADEIKKLGYKAVIWSIDTLDWSQKESSNISKNVLDNVRNGDIILMHSNADKKTTAEALPEIIKGLREKGYDMVTLDDLLGIAAYKK